VYYNIECQYRILNILSVIPTQRIHGRFAGIMRYKWCFLWVRSEAICAESEHVVFLGTRANAELVPKFQVALHASHAALPMVTNKNFALH
jgi:hypothetical protein